MQKPALELRASRLFAAWLFVIVICAVAAAAASRHAWPLKAVLLLSVCALLLRAWHDETRRGLRYLGITGDDVIALAHADGSMRTACYAGHATLGRFAIFVFTERTGWQRFLGPERHTVLMDAVDPDEFRRLRAWVRLGL